MNALLPIIEELASAVTDEERADWLLSCPLSVLFKYQDSIINRLRNAHFLDGVAYVEAELALTRKVRKLGLNNDSNPMLDAMWHIAGVDPFGTKASPTDL